MRRERYRFTGAIQMPTFPSVELTRVPKVAASELRLLWVNDWYDGPLEAVVEHRGESCLMVLHHQDLASESPYKWLLFRLTPEQLADEVRWHSLYVDHVGDHWCFHGDSVVTHGPPRSDRTPDEFRDLYRGRDDVDLTGNVVVGWTDEMPKR